MIQYRVIIQPEHRERIARLPPSIKQKLHAGLRLLETDPLIGNPLEQELTGYRSYPIHPYRIIYRIEPLQRIIHLVRVAHRREVYDRLLEGLDFIRDRRRIKRKRKSYRLSTGGASLLR